MSISSLRLAGSVVLALCAAFALAACQKGDPRAPFTDSQIPPGLQSRFYPPDGWAWGLVKIGKAPAARYGVASPPRRPRADVMILAGYGEPAETWFETARDLNDQGYVVWVLEPVGQGGSGRYALPRDVGDAPTLAPDIAGAKALAAGAIHRRPLVVIASGAAAPAALAAAESGLASEGLILSSPAFTPPDAGQPWRREAPDDHARGLTHDARRGKLALAWQTANPDLRMGGPDHRWRKAFGKAATAALGGAGGISTPMLLLQPAGGDAAAAAMCRRLARCQAQSFGPAGSDLQLEVDEVRAAWLKAVIAFTEADIARFAPPPPQARLAPEG